ncbi:phosphate signaling complex protein PhoU [Bacillaceae bacterium S4-13-56]
MQVRKNFEMELEQQKQALLKMVEFSNKMLVDSVEALRTQNLELAQQVIDFDKQLNQMEIDVNDKAIQIIVKEGPVAKDLRKVIVSLKISSDVERIGDLAVNIAKSTLIIGKEPLVAEITEIPRVIEIIKDMLHKSVSAFNYEDVSIAKYVADQDDKVDEYYGKFLQEMITLFKLYPNNTNQILQLSFICRYIERIGDHITNIAENIVYLVKGKRYDLD